MTWSKHLARPLAFAVITLTCPGCPPEAVKMINQSPSPQASGTWTGRLVSVTVRDHSGAEYAAAALDIETGPRTLRNADTRETVDDQHDTVLLCRGMGIIDPTEMKFPVGSTVRVSGTFFRGTPIKSFVQPGAAGGVVKGVTMAPPGHWSGTLVIQVRSEPRRLDR